jgi:hypothetical protein
VSALIASVVPLASGCDGGSSAPGSAAASTTVAPVTHIVSHGLAMYRVAPSSAIGVCEMTCAPPQGIPVFRATRIAGVHDGIGQSGTWLVLLILRKGAVKRFSKATAELGHSTKVLFTADGRPVMVFAWMSGRDPNRFIQVNDLTQAQATRIKNDLQPLEP